MIVYRFVHKKYASDISGNGAKLKGGRWNPKGIAVLYSSEHISLGLLEVLANANTLEELQQLQLMELELPSTSLIEEIKAGKLKDEWYKDFDYSQYLGGEILKQNKSLLIKCPSAVVYQEFNYLINPLHADFKKIKVKRSDKFYFDHRLFKKND